MKWLKRGAEVPLTLIPALILAGSPGVAVAQHTQPGTTPPANSAPAQTTGKPVAAQPAVPAAKPSTVDDNPFPEEESKAAQKAAAESEREDRKAAGTGPAASSAADEGSSSRDKLAGIDILGDRESRISNGAGGTVVDPKLAAKDLQVGQQYYSLGNYQGAYERFKEAVTVNPGNLDAVFYLAEAARKTAHLDESAESYRVYLEAQPDGGKSKAARKALAQLAGK